MALVGVIEKLEGDNKNKQILDNIYDEVCNVIIEEMNNVIPFKDIAVGSEYKKFIS